ncbi:MAG TPA: hypothetical protein VMU15_12365 [Anaeromyxobacter sp.]|nr:hypothetical protein [Anaeromyxobacter sp.]
MAEVKTSASAPPSAGGTRGGTGFELRLERGGASVRLADQELAPGLSLEALSLQIPDVRFPFDVGQGAAQFRHRLSDLSELSVAAGASFLEATLLRAPLAQAGLLDVRLELRPGFAELAGRLAAGPPFAMKAGVLAHGIQGLRILFHSPRVFGPTPFPAVALPHLLARALAGTLGERGELDPVPALLRQALAPRAWKLPRVAGLRLARAQVDADAVRVAWARASGEPAAVHPDPDLLAAEEGRGAFGQAEEAIAQGDPARARELLLSAGPAAAVHPFSAERLLSLLTLEERFHDEALDLAADWLGRRPGFAPALAAEALVRLARGEERRAALALAELAAAAAQRGEVFAALLAAQAAFELPGAAPADATRAVDVALSLRRDHVPALRALRALAAAAGDREALLRADRRLVAYDPDEARKARAHAELGELLREADPAAARLHLDQALRLAPDDPAALAALARACAAAGEALRAIRALDRLRDVELARGDRAAAAAAAQEAGALWEGPLGHAENALLRYRAAAELAPSAELHAAAARAAEKLGQWVEAADHHAAVLASLDPSSPGAVATLVHTRLALADVAERRLTDPAGAAAHLEAAAVLKPGDPAILSRLAALHRDLGRADGLAAALDRLAPLSPPPERAALLAQAGEALLSLGQAEGARARFAAALAHDPASRPALTGLVRLARERGDALGEREALARLLPLAAGPAELAELHDRLAAAGERAGDLNGAVRAARAARAALPTPARLETELRLARLAGDDGALLALLPEAALAAAAGGDPAKAGALRLEQARLLAPAAPAAALAALAEAHAAAPGDPAVLRAQAELAERTGDLRLALAALRALLATSPVDASALDVRAARTALAAGELTAAREHAARAEAAGAPGAGEMLSEVLDRTGDLQARAELLVRMGRPEAAAEVLDRAGRPLEAAPLLARMGHHRAAARAYLAGGNRSRAAEALARAADDPALALEVLPELAELLASLDDAGGAAGALLRLARLKGGREGALLAWHAHGLSPSAAALEAAIACDPGFAPARARRARLRAGEDPRGALADAQAALDAPEPAPDGERPALLSLAVDAALACGEGEAARRLLAVYCELVPGDEQALARLATLHREAADAPALSAVLRQRLEAAQGAEATALRLELADLSAGSGDPAGAARLLEEALEGEPSALEPLRALLAPRLAGALPPPRRAELLGRLAAHPAAERGEVVAALGERARFLAEAGHGPAALEALRAAAALAPEDDAALELRASLATAARLPAEAAQALLTRARRAVAGGEPGAADRLAEAGLAAFGAGLGGAEQAMDEALGRGPRPDNARAVCQTLVELALSRRDAERERALLATLVPLLRTGERPAALLRLASLSLASGDLPAARRSAEEARSLAPRDPVAVEAARAAAEAEGDLGAVAERLGELAELVPAERGALLLRRARLLVGLGRVEEADRAFSGALEASPPDLALAEEHARLRRDHLPAAPAAEPLERLAARLEDPRRAAHSLRAAAGLALAAGDDGAALRCARRAYARTQGEPAYAGPLLARLLYQGGSWAEALSVHRRLLEAGPEALPPEEALPLAHQLAELAEDGGEVELARSALERVLALRPSDLDAALRRFALDPDRARAVHELAEQADASRSSARRAEALAVAAEAALAETGDAPLAEVLFQRAREAARRLPALAAAVARRRVEAFRAAEGSRSPVVAEALDEAVERALQGGDRGQARRLLAQAVDRDRASAQPARISGYLRRLSALAAEDGDTAAAGALSAEAAELLAAAGQLEEALSAIDLAAGAPAAALDRSLARIEDLARERGAPLLHEVLRRRIALAAPGKGRAPLRVRLAEAWLASGEPGADGRAEAELRAALADDPTHASASDQLSRRLLAAGREAERARLLLERASHQTDRREAVRLRREAAGLLARAPDTADRAIAAATFSELAEDDPRDLEAHRSAAALFRELGQRERAIPHLAAVVRASPDDEAAAQALADAYSDRHRDRAELFLSRAERAQGAERAGRLREAARALFAAGEDERARAALVSAFQAWPADDTAFVAALREATADPERLDAVLSARAAAVPAEAPACHRARADALLAFGEVDRAVEAYRAALAIAPDDVATLAALAACLSAGGREAEAREVDGRLLARARAEPQAVPPSAEASARYRVGIAAWAEGRAADGIEHLERALAIAPADDRAGIAWAALSYGHATRGDAGLALAAARNRAERALALGLAEERRVALEAGAELAGRLGDAGPDAAELLVALLERRRADGEPPGSLEPLARRTASCLTAIGQADRARAVLESHGLVAAAAPPPPAPEAESPPEAGPADEVTAPLAPVVDLFGGREPARAPPAGEGPPAEPSPGEIPVAALPPAELVPEDLAPEEPAPAPPEARPAEIPAAAAAAPPPAPPPAEAPAAPPAVEAPTPPVAGDPREAARREAERALAQEDPAARVAGLLAYADALAAAGAPADEVRAAIDLATEADPDAAAPWQARARLETAAGDAMAAGRALLSVSIRTEGDEAARAALEAARLFAGAGLPAEAARAYRAAVLAHPSCAPARNALADEAMAAGDPEAAAGHLSAIAPDALPAEERPAHARRLARAFEDAGRRADAEAVWAALFQADPEDREAFRHAAGLARARGAIETWIELAQAHEPALARAGDAGARADLRCQRGEVLAAAGRLEAARGALLSALELVPGHERATAVLAELDERRDGWERATAELAAEVAQATDPAERAALHLRQARILRDRLQDFVAAAVAAGEALVEARRSPSSAARRTFADAEALLRELGHLSGEPASTPPAAADPVSSVLRAQAEAARGLERADLFERLAGHLQRSGDREAAADALLAALEVDPDRPATHAWLRSLAAGDPVRLSRADALRAGEGPAPSPAEETPATAAPPRTTLRYDVGPPADRPAATPPPAQGDDLLDFPLLDLGEPAQDSLGFPGATPFPPLDLEADLGAAEQQLAEPAGAGEGAPGPGWSPAPAAPEPAPPLPASGQPPREDLLPELDAEGLALRGPGPEAPHDERALAAALAPEPTSATPAAPPAAPATAQASGSAQRGREHLEAQDWELAYAELSDALEAAPDDAGLVRDLMRAAERLGHYERYVELGELGVDALASTDPLAAAARLRHLAQLLRTRLAAPDRAAILLERALVLVPGDPDTQRELAATLAERPRSATRALESWLAIARQDPSDGGALSALAALCARGSGSGGDTPAAARLAEQGRLAASLASFVTPASPTPPPPRLPARIPSDLRADLAVAPAAGPSARLLSLLAPWLEPLFPADLTRRGASAADWLAPPRAPTLRAAIEAASRALSTRPHASFLTKRPGVEISVENTQPPAMVFSAGAGELPELQLTFVAARTLDLVQHGWALAGRFAPRDVGILLELACRFAGGTAPSLGLPAERAGSFLSALGRSVPAGVLERARLLAPEVGRELASFDPRALVDALRRTSNRVALLYAGEPASALRALSVLDRPGEVAPEPAQAVGLPDLHDLAVFALSDRFVELRLTVLDGRR